MAQGTENREHILNVIPGGIVVCRVEEDKFRPVFFSAGLAVLGGYTGEEFEQIVGDNLLNLLPHKDWAKFLDFAALSRRSGEDVNLLLRIKCRDGSVKECHFNGSWQVGEKGEQELYGVFTRVSAESRLVQSIANETADGIYVMHRDTYELLYVSEEKKLFQSGDSYIGQKCYAFLHGQEAPCPFCTLKTHPADGTPHRMPLERNGKFYDTRFREVDWNGIPAYAKYVQDVTEDVLLEKDRMRLEQYFQTVLKYLPGGAAVVRHENSGAMIPEFLSDGFSDMVCMTKEEAWRMYQQNALSGVHPDDREYVSENLAKCIAEGRERYEMMYRLRKGTEGYIWVKAVFSVIQNEGGDARVYVIYYDITKEKAEQEQIREQYRELILQHYLTPGPNALVLGHCNITRNRILEIVDNLNAGLLETFGHVREEFFEGIGSWIPDITEREEFRSKYLNKPSLEAFGRGETEVTMICYFKPAKMEMGRYVQFKVNLVETPDTRDVTGILTVTDMTEQIIANKILRQASLNGYDVVAEVNLFEDSYKVLSGTRGEDPTGQCEKYSEHIRRLKEQIIPRDRERAMGFLDAEYISERTKKEESFSFSYSLMNSKGEIFAKSITISAIDLRLGRVCLTRTDITDSVREQQGLLNMIAYTFELACFISLDTGSLTMYTKEIVLKNLTPYTVENYKQSMEKFILQYSAEENREEMRQQFLLENMMSHLEKTPGGYDFVAPFQVEGKVRYKQINVLWGDESRKTICLVRADVTDMLAEEMKSKNELERALAMAEEASRAKSDFLSSMSHDIRTPMNAIMGMTALALHHLDDPERTEEYLHKISTSSRHLLSLINDILDMSQIERSKIQLNRMRISMNEIIEQIRSIMTAQAKNAGLDFQIHVEGIQHGYFYGDALRINQILINLLSNAFKFTPEGGSVDFTVKETEPLEKEGRVRFLYTVRDTGIGMTEEFLSHLFEPFVRSADTARVEGTGLGLSITKGLVELMNGVIRVESRLREGTVFQIELEHEIAGEAVQIPGREACEGDGNGNVLAGRRFLVVEDNAINSEILCELLQMKGAESAVCENGLLGVKEFESAAPGTYDAILMDVQMPVMNGFEATRVIRRLPRQDAKTIPIIAMTANAFAEDVQASIDAGMNAHVAKPIDMRALCSALAKLFAR